MKIIIRVYVFVQNVIYSIIKLFKIDDNKILFLSRQSDALSLDYRMLIDKINEKYKDKNIVTITKRTEKNVKSFVFKNFFLNFKIMYHLATSKVVVIDGYNMLVSILKHKKRLVIIQIWHSLGAIKKFGLDSLQTKKDIVIARELKMHKNYDHILTGSKAMIKYFKKSFGYSEDKFVPLGLPRIDYILKNDKKDIIYDKYPQFKNKRVIMYAPTFRDDDNYEILKLIDAIDTKKYILIFKAHDKMKYEKLDNKEIYTCDEFSSIDLLCITDYLITDYSAISIEASIINTRIFIYAYDLDRYKINPGLNIDLKKELPTYTDAKKLYEDLDSGKYDYKKLNEFKEKYVPNLNGDVTDKIADYIVDRMVEDEI